MMNEQNNTRTIKQKLTSRKFIVSMITAIAGIVTMIIGHEEDVSVVSGALCTILPTLAYCIIEGAADIKSIQTITDATSGALRELGKTEAADQVDLFGDVAEALVDEDANGDTESREIPVKTLENDNPSA